MSDNENDQEFREGNELEDEEVEVSEDEDLEDAMEEVAPAKAKKGKKKKHSTFIDDAAEEDEDGGGGRGLKRSRFIDDIADVDDDEEDDELEGEGVDDLIDEEAPDANDLAEVRRAMRDADRKIAEEEDINPEELQKYLEERFGGARGEAYAAAEGADTAGAVSQQALMPTPRDPKLWVVRCAEGAEREIVVCLLQKCYDYAARGQPLLIKSVFCKDELKGYLYVEAHKEAHVRDALKGLRSIFHSKPPKLVPLGEMVAAVTVPRTTGRMIAANSWVRLKAGLYKGDLARVVDVDINSGRVTVKVVPRLDYAAMAARRSGEDGAGGRGNFGKAPKVRPPQRAFNPDEAKGARLDVVQQRDRGTGELHWLLGSSQRFQGGYLLKNMAIKGVGLEEELPPLDELQRFNAAAQDEDDAAGTGAGAGGDLADIIAGLAGGEGGLAELEEAAGKGRFAQGDRVVVEEGDLKHIKGRVQHITEGGMVEVRLSDEALGGFSDVVAFAPRELAKFFQGGDHVKVVHGSNVGETGMVVRVDGPVCYLITDTSRQEIKVFARDLSDAVAVSSSLDSIGGYDLFDLVVLDAQTVGVIVGVDKDCCSVLTNQGRPEKPDLRVCRLPDLKRKMDSRRASTQDGMRNEVGVKDIVEVFDGPLKGRSGTVKHIMRGFLFVQSREVPDHGGFFCVQARHCKVRGGKRGVGMTGGMASVLATPARIYPGAAPMGNVLASPARQGPGGYGGGAPGPGAYGGRQAAQQDRLLENKVVTIKSGPYRGLTGHIKSATASHVRVELEAQMKTVTVSRTQLPADVGGVAAARPQHMGMSLGMGGAHGYGMGAGSVHPLLAPMAAPGGRTPAHYSAALATPAHYSMMGSSTPMHPGMTPGREGVVTQTPAYDAAWGATPAHSGFGSNGFSMGAPAGGQQYGQLAASDAMSAPPPAAVAAPAPGGVPDDWVGLEVVLLSGESAAVRSVDALGAAKVELGTKISPDSAACRFSTGQVRSVRLSDLQVARPGRGDRMRLLSGALRGKEFSVERVEGGEVFFKSEEGRLSMESLATCGKLAVDA